MNGEWLNHLEFADDQVLIGKTPDKIKRMANDLKFNYLG